MFIKDLLDKIAKAKAEMIANRERDALAIATDQIALMKLRIQSEGADFDNVPFVPYSAGYAQERKDAGYQIAFVDLTRSGRFLASFVPVVTDSNVFSATVEIRPGSAEMVTRLTKLQRKRPKIVGSTPEEIELVRKANRARIKKYFNF